MEENKDVVIDFFDLMCNTFNQDTSLPFSAKYFVMKQVMAELEKTYSDFINKYRASQQQQEAEAK